MVGKEALEVLKKFQLANVDDKKIKGVCDQFEAYCTSRKTVTYEHYKFFSHVQNLYMFT